MQNKRQFTVIGSGQYIYDIIKKREYPEGFVIGKRNKFEEKVIQETTGGTCGNVMCMLNFFGWHVMPQAQFGTDAMGLKHTQSLADEGCDMRYVENIDGGTCSIIRFTHGLDQKTGLHKLGRRGEGPDGSMFRKVKNLRAKDEAPALLAWIDEAPDVYFFDSYEAGYRALAAGLKERGSLVYFEAESCKELSKFMKAVEIADIVKFSDENIPDISVVEGLKGKLLIQTLGAQGLRFRLPGSDWVNVPPSRVENCVDWEGCGDTTTATFLNELGKMGLPKITELTEDQVKTALEKACRQAARCTQHLGSKGWMRAGDIAD